MSDLTVVRYRVHEGEADANAELVRDVYEELAEVAPPSFRYATFLLDDGRTFVHLAINESDETAPLTGLPAFRRFQEGLAERCEEPPVVSSATEVGSYRL